MNFSRSNGMRLTDEIFFNRLHHGCFPLAFLIFCSIAAAAQGAPASWLRAFGSSGSGNNISNGIKVGPDQNLYITGQFSSTADFGATQISSAGGLDIFVAKYGPSGALLWIAQAGGKQDDFGQSLDLDTAGNVYVTGRFQGSATFHSAASNGKTITVSSVELAIFVAKYNSSGTLQWVQTGIISTDVCAGCFNWGYGIAVNSAAGSVYITALSQSNTTFSSADGSVHVVAGAGTWHMVLAKYDINGNFKWAQTNEASPNSIPSAVAVDAADNVYAVGWLEDSTTFFSADGRNITVVGFSPGQTSNDFPDDIFLVKYDKNGNAQWVNHIGGYKAVANAVTVGPSGEITLAGFVGNIVNSGMPSEAETIATSQPLGTNINLGGGQITNPYNRDVVIATYSGSGVLTRALRRGGTGDENATGVAYDSHSTLYVTGVAQANGQSQLFVDYYPDGKLLWEATAANAGILAGQPALSPALSADAAGSVFVTGGYSGTASFGSIKLNSTGTAEAFVAELNTAFANQVADLFLRVQPSTLTVHQSDLLTFAFPVWNLGPDVAYHEVLNTQVPAGTVFDYVRISGTPGLGTCTTPPYQGTGQIVCHENAAMAPNTTWTVRLTVKVTASAGTVITANAATMSGTPDPNMLNNMATVSLTVQ